MTQKAFNNTPGFSRKGRLAHQGQARPTAIRCNHAVDEKGETCNRFPAWELAPFDAKDDRVFCEYHLTEAEGRDLTPAQEGSLARGA